MTSVTVGITGPAAAATPPVGVFPAWSATGAGAFDAVFPAASGFPTAHVTTDNTGAGVAAGKSAFLGPTTGFGQQFGTSRLQPYLTIGALGLTTASTTTIVFDSPTPVGWSMAFGDIDADYVSIVATSGGVPLTSDQLGVRDSTPGSPYLNYCRAASPKPTGCSALDAPYDSFPTWCPAGAGGSCVGLPENTVLGSGTDTSGSYQWFVPTVPVDQVTLTFTPQLGFPSFQLWIVAPSPATTVTGVVQLGSQPGETIPDGVALELLDAAGQPVTDMQDEPVIITVEPDGAFEFTTADGDYQLDIMLPEGVQPTAQFPYAFTASGDALDLGVLAIASPPTLAATGTDIVPPLLSAIALLGVGFALRRRSLSRG